MKPFGRNEGDCWLGEGSPVQQMIDAEGGSEKLIHEMVVRDGELVEVVYVTDDADVIERATVGTTKYERQQVLDRISASRYN